MQIKVFKAGNMKDAMATMKKELGEEAVILHSKKYKEGGLLGIGSREVVEITAAVEESSLPKKPEPQRLKHPSVATSSILNRYKTDGTAQAVAGAEKANENLSAEKKDETSSTQIDNLEEKISAQKNSPAPSKNFEEMLNEAQDDSLSSDESGEKSVSDEVSKPPYRISVTENKSQNSEESSAPEESSQPSEKVSEPEESSQPSEKVSEPEESSQPSEKVSKPEESSQPSEKVSEPEEKPQPSEKVSEPEEKPQPSEKVSESEEKPQPSEKFSEPEEKPQPSEKISVTNEAPQPSKKVSLTNEAPQSQQVAGFTQEQMAQTQAMIMAQFNQLQMIQQAAIAQAQAQAAEQLRLQQAQQAAIAQAQPSTANEEKIKKLEEEIAQMKALLAEIMGRDSKKGGVSLHEALKLQEVDEEILKEMAAQAPAGETLADIHAPAAKTTLTNYLNEHLKFSDGVKLNRHGVRIVALLGTTGVGKTTTLAKIAAKFVLEQKTNVALITADTYRISAVEQLKTYSDILELPLEIVYNPQELASAIERHRHKELILIDTAGRSQHNEYQMRELEEFLRVNPRIEKHLVISATTKFTDAKQIMKKFSQVNPDKIIFTKIDETGSVGMIVNLLNDNRYSLSYITTGQSVPDDIERASSEMLANLLLQKVEE